MTFKEFKNTWETEILPNKPIFIRKGQSLMNYLADVNFEEYKTITASIIDCFYDDNLIPNVMQRLERVWKL